MKIHVTQEHIQAGVRFDCCRCPLALALQDAGISDARTGLTAWWRQDNNGPVHRLSLEAVLFRSDYDAGRTAVPFCFEVEG